ncbi:MAG: hypothetical protein P1V20_29880 [Verrucomicrobiales bacterium]|nr:hypothetical protein [Verrucomicrobiales bacterium]
MIYHTVSDGKLYHLQHIAERLTFASMIRLFCFVSILVAGFMHSGLAQKIQDDGFALVQDSDGWSNVRGEPSTNSNILGRIDHGELIWCFLPNDPKWVPVFYIRETPDKKVGLYGFIHSSRLKPLSSFKEIPGKLEPDTKVTFQSDRVKVEIEEEKFDPVGISITKVKTESGFVLVKDINNKTVWGTDGTMPTAQYRKFSVVIDGKDVSPPAEAVEDLFEPGVKWLRTRVFHETGKNTLYITTLNGDGAGGYVAAFVFEKGKYTKRIVHAPY